MFWPKIPIQQPLDSIPSFSKTQEPMKIIITNIFLKDKTKQKAIDYTVHGILQARILEWVNFPFSGGSS